MHAVGMDDFVRDADIVITGDGCIDGQTVHGKTPIGVAAVAIRHGKPVIGIADASVRALPRSMSEV
jgi:glycerate kinase